MALEKQGWTKILKAHSSSANTECTSDKYWIYVYTPAESIMKAMHPESPLFTMENSDHKFLTPGLHIFKSQLALSQYVARFPFLLQPDITFTQTLIQIGWIKMKKSNKW